MARFFLFVALALCASAVVADECIYNDDQLDVLNSRMTKCVAVVPPVSDFDRPGDICRFEGIDVLLSGAVKEAVTARVVLCLQHRKVAQSVVFNVRACLKQKMAERV